MPATDKMVTTMTRPVVTVVMFVFMMITFDFYILICVLTADSDQFRLCREPASGGLSSI
jgi:hypothetical protein